MQPSRAFDAVLELGGAQCAVVGAIAAAESITLHHAVVLTLRMTCDARDHAHSGLLQHSDERAHKADLQTHARRVHLRGTTTPAGCDHAYFAAAKPSSLQQ